MARRPFRATELPESWPDPTSPRNSHPAAASPGSCIRSLIPAALLFLPIVTMSTVGHTALGTVLFEQKISTTECGFTEALDFLDRFGTAIAALGNPDADNVIDLAFDALQDDDGGTDRGAV